jgi:putative nucleotidyltransferase with HDIG domain
MTRLPPTLLARTAAATFATVLVVLTIVFVVLTIDTRDRVRASEAERLQVSERMFTAFEARRQRDQLAAIATLAENPTLKAALDTYASERMFSGHDADHEAALRRTIVGEVQKLATTVSAGVLAILDTDDRVFTATGPFANSWSGGTTVTLPTDDAPTFQGVALLSGGAFLMSGARLEFGDHDVGTLIVGTSLDQEYANQLAALSHSGVVIAVEGTIVARTVDEAIGHALLDANVSADTTLALEGEEHAVGALLISDRARVYLLTSIDTAARAATRAALMTLASVAAGSLLLAGLATFWLARALTRPINGVAQTLAAMASRRDGTMSIAPTGSSRELDALTAAFNELLAGLTAAEAETRATYVGSIRALAAALDARDEYTAGHSDRVSEVSVLIARQMGLDESEIEVIRLGALLHDIGKIGVSDAVLRKAGPLTPDEYEQIKRHPGLGAHILRQVPFLAPYIPIVELHHERPDGKGYPFGLRHEEIPVSARIVHVADTYDAMTTARAYRSAHPHWFAVAELQRYSGTQFDPASVAALIAAVPVTSPVVVDHDNGERLLRGA